MTTGAQPRTLEEIFKGRYRFRVTVGIALMLWCVVTVWLLWPVSPWFLAFQAAVFGYEVGQVLRERKSMKDMREFIIEHNLHNVY